MAQPARRARRVQEQAPVDPHAVERAYRLEKAKRRARVQQKRERRHAHLRFYVVIAALLVLSAVVVVTVLREVERLFGV
jgi:hypothetical protein